jgi:hypothetical protein
MTNLFVKDKSGKDVDVVLGYDVVDYYGTSFFVAECVKPVC